MFTGLEEGCLSPPTARSPLSALRSPRRCHVQGGTKEERAGGLASRLRQLRRPCQARAAGSPVWVPPALPACRRAAGRGARAGRSVQGAPCRALRAGRSPAPVRPQAFVAEASCRWVNGAEEIGEGRQKWSLKEGVSTGQPDKGQNTHGRRGTDGTGKRKQLGLECGGGARLHRSPVNQAGRASFAPGGSLGRSERDAGGVCGGAGASAPLLPKSSALLSPCALDSGWVGGWTNRRMGGWMHGGWMDGWRAG